MAKKETRQREKVLAQSAERFIQIRGNSLSMIYKGIKTPTPIHKMTDFMLENVLRHEATPTSGLEVHEYDNNLVHTRKLTLENFKTPYQKPTTTITLTSEATVTGVELGATTQISATIENGVEGDELAYRSNGTSTISPTGLVTMEDTSSIDVEIFVKNKESINKVINITPATPVLTVSKEALTATANTTEAVTVSLTKTRKPYTVKSDNTSIATVQKTESGFTMTYVAEGTCNVTLQTKGLADKVIPVTVSAAASV